MTTIHRQSRVFVTQQPKPNEAGWTPNLSPASRFGAIHFIFSGSDHPSNDPDGAIFQASEALEDFNPISDYVLWPNGVDPFSIWAVLIVLSRKAIPIVRGLSWNRGMTEQGRDKRMGYYTPVTFRIDNSIPYSINLSVPQPSKEKRTWPQSNQHTKSNNRHHPYQSHKPQASTSPVAKPLPHQPLTRSVQ